MDGVTLPPELARLDADTREIALALAVEIVTAPQPLAGLTMGETRLVRVLSAARGRVVPHEPLAQAACRGDEPVIAKTAAVHVCRIRRKRPDIGIETVWGEGFRLVGEVQA